MTVVGREPDDIAGAVGELGERDHVGDHGFGNDWPVVLGAYAAAAADVSSA